MPRATSVGMEPLDELCTWDDDDVSDWGRGTYGHPCRECGYDWPDDLDVMIEVVRQTPTKMRSALGGSDGTGRDPTLIWDARSYVCHVVDNLRIWAERLVAALDVPAVRVGPYDADLLAASRNYAAVPVAGALWSLTDSVDAWLRAVDAARGGEIDLDHPERGTLRLIDVASTNAHDAYHHVFDVERSVV